MSSKLKFIIENDTFAATIDYSELISAAGSSSPLTIIRQSTFTKPSHLFVNYTCLVEGYNNLACKKHTRISRLGQAKKFNPQEIELPLVITDEEASKFADEMHTKLWIMPILLKFNLPPKYMYLDGGDMIKLIKNDEEYILSLNSTAIGWDGTIICEGLLKRLENLPFLWQLPYIPPRGTPIVPTVFEILDLPMLDISDNVPCIYLSVVGDTRWSEGGLYIQDATNRDYMFLCKFSKLGGQGTATSSLGAWANENIDDNAHNIVVSCNLDLQDAPGDTIYESSINLALLGNEIIQFRTVEQINPGIWKLSHLLRGRRGTEWAMNMHQIGDQFILLDDSYITKVPLSDSLIGQQLNFKAIYTHESLENVTPFPLTFEAVNLKSYHPTNRHAFKLTVTGWVISWQRRAKEMIGWKIDRGISLTEDSEQFYVDIVDHNNNIKRTIMTDKYDPSTDPMGEPVSRYVIYSPTQQIEDWGETQNHIHVRISQVCKVGRGMTKTDLFGVE